METFMMVKAKQFRALLDYYKWKITESSLLDKAAHMATAAHQLIEDETTPSALKEPVVKELMMTERDLALSFFFFLFLFLFFFLFFFLFSFLLPYPVAQFPTLHYFKSSPVGEWGNNTNRGEKTAPLPRNR